MNLIVENKILEYEMVLKEFDRAERAQAERDRSNGVYYRLDDDEMSDYIQNFCINNLANPEREFLRKWYTEILYDALKKLPEVQLRRVYKHFFARKCYCEIAREENVDESAVRRSIERAIIRLKPLLCGTGISKSDFERPVPTRYIKHRREKKTLEKMYPVQTVISDYEGGDLYE
jgi:hypothetical protein